MILTVTANPMMEHLFHQPEFVAWGDHCPLESAVLMPAGKSINATRVLKNLDEQVVSAVAVGGATGREIQVGLGIESLAHRFVAINRKSRWGITVFDGKEETSTVYGAALATEIEVR
jgi:fructose-1-phosphate kinase PfkB-like protein